MEQTGLQIQGQTLLRYSGAQPEITLTAAVAQIDAQAFRGCTALNAITMEANYIRVLGENLFADCTALQKVSIWGEVENHDGIRFTRPAALRDYLGLSPQVILEWECPTVWCLEGRCQFCGGTLKGSVMRSCSVCGRFA